jgi:putative Mn2+ efflux pump MntP
MWFELLALSVALAMDATVVAAARGLAARHRSERIRDALRMALAFGGAQALMPLAGYAVTSALGRTLGDVVQAWDHWVAAVLLCGIGAKMVREAFAADDVAERSGLGFSALMLLAMATSIDAFAAGITLPVLALPVATSIVTIGLVTALCSGLAAWFAQAIAAHSRVRFKRTLEVVGGLVLVALGVGVLLEHLAQ